MEREAFIQFEILKAWGASPLLRLWRQNTGVAKMGDRSVRFGIPGQGDLSGLILPNGRRLEIEVKSETGRQTEEQKRFERMITAFGGLYILARSVAEVDQALAAIGVTR